MTIARSLLGAFVLALGIAIGGGLVGWGFARGRSADRYVAPGVNESGQLQKVVRVVSTVQYFLE